jgi:DNA-binding FrmR family transcriptional regulator
MSQHKRKDVAMRIKRVHGHVHSIVSMLEEGRSYPEIVQQITAVRAALDSTIQVIIDDLVEDCMTRAQRNDSLQGPLLELQAVVGKIR